MSLQIEVILRLLLATALGAAIGYERERAGKAAGLRTHILIAAGSALFTLVSSYGFAGGAFDPSRIAAGVVAGIGFIGAGAIFRGEDRVAGLTTAAGIWIVAAIGLAAGAGMYLLSIVATLITVIVLMLPRVRG